MIYDKSIEKQKLIRLIHVAKRDLAMDDDAYRALLQRVGGAESSKDMSIVGLEKVIFNMKRLGFRLKVGRDSSRQQTTGDGLKPVLQNPWGFVFNAAPERQPLLKKIYRLAETIGAFQDPKINVMPPHYVEGIVRQINGLPKAVIVTLAFTDADVLRKVVQTMTVYIRRQNKVKKNEAA